MTDQSSDPNEPSAAQTDSDTRAGHLPVLPTQVLDLLNPQEGETFVDCTLGRGGHAALIAEQLGETGTFIGLDVDPENLAYSEAVLKDIPCQVHLVQANFATLRNVLRDLQIDHVDGLLADLGFASNQMDNPERGFSFQADGPLDMRLDPDLAQSAADLVNRLPEKQLADLIYQYGEERASRKIARKIVENREIAPIKTTLGLARIVRSALNRPAGKRPGRKGSSRNHPRSTGGGVDPATRTFMALRIAVNGELEVLQALLDSLPHVLGPGGRGGIISFHSLEDRMVKHAMLAMSKELDAERVTRKPVTAEADEVRDNPRSRSAKFRVIRMADS